jgi:hypothetical protein
MRRSVRCLVFAALAVVVALPVAGFTWQRAQPQTTIKIVPPDLKVRTGREATIELVVESVSELYGAQVQLGFDPQVLEVVDANASEDGIQIEPGSFPKPDFVVQNLADNTQGTIQYALTQLPPNEPQEGNGIVARVTFRAKTPAVTQIEFHHYLLADAQGGSIAAVPEDGRIRVVRGSTWILVTGSALLGLLLVGGFVGFAIKKEK